MPLSTSTLQERIKDFNEARLVFDHYTQKLNKLREERTARSSRGKKESPQEAEKHARVSSDVFRSPTESHLARTTRMQNEEKLAKARSDYQAVAASVVAEMNGHCELKAQKVDGVFVRVSCC